MDKLVEAISSFIKDKFDVMKGDIVEKISRGEGKIEDLALMNKIGKNMQAGSLCGHGQLGYNPISSALKHFQKDFEECMNGNCPTGSCEKRNIVFPINTRPNAWQAKTGEVYQGKIKTGTGDE